MHAAPRLFALTLLSSALLVACDDGGSSGGGGGGGASTTLNATPSLGKVMNAAVEARCLASGSVIGTGDTGTTGTASIALTAACTGPVIIELAPNGGTTYYDEKLGTTASFTGGALRTLLPSVSGSTVNVAITPLTEIATRQALQAAGNVESAITPTQINTANSAVGAQVFGSLATGLNILQPPTVWDSSIAAGALGTSSADRYALLLAGLAGMASAGSAAPALDVANALAADLQDGTLSGATSTGFTYTAGNFATLRTTALNTFATYASSALQSALGITGGGGGGGGGSTGVTTPSGHNISSTTAATYLPLMSNPNGKIINYDEGTLGLEIYDYVDTLNVSVADSNPLMSITVNATYNACALNASWVTADTPSCTSMGITFNRSTGQVSFANTPMKPIFGTCNGAASCTINGSLSFTPY